MNEDDTIPLGLQELIANQTGTGENLSIGTDKEEIGEQEWETYLRSLAGE